MAKKLPPFIRVDALFVNADDYIAMGKQRNVAYLFLLAMTGNRRFHKKDGLLSCTTAEAIAAAMGLKANPLLAALAEVHLIELIGEDVDLSKYAKWQDTAAEIEAAEERAYANGTRGGRPKNQNLTKLVSDPITNPEPKPNQTLTKVGPDRERDRERDREDLDYVDIGLAWEKLTGRPLSASDRDEARTQLLQLDRLTTGEIIGYLGAFVDWWMLQNIGTAPRLKNAVTWLKEKNVKAADNRRPLASRSPAEPLSTILARRAG